MCLLHYTLLISELSSYYFCYKGFVQQPWAPAGGSKGERSLPPGKLKKKKKKKKWFERKKCTNEILTCKRPPSYVMRRNFLTKGPHVM